MDAHTSQGHGGVRAITYWAWRLDRVLNRQIGAPYRIILAVGLMAGISESVNTLANSFHSTTNVLLIVTTVVFQAALLVNQLAQSHQRRRARLRRQAMKALKTPAT